MMQSSTVSDVLHTPKQEFQLAGQPVSAYPPSSDAGHCDLMSEVGHRPLTVVVDAVLDASLSPGQMMITPEKQSTSDICLGSESFLQSLESIPLPSLVSSGETAALYSPVTSYPDLYASVSRAKHLSTSAAATSMQQELLQAWGSAGPPSNFNVSSGGGFVQMPFTSSAENSADARAPRCVPRAIRSRGRGRGMRRKLTPSSAPSGLGPSSRPSFSPRCSRRSSTAVCRGDVRTDASTTTTPAQSYATVMSTQLPPVQTHSGNNGGSLPRGEAAPGSSMRQAYNRQSSSETRLLLNSEVENQANEKMNAYIEKFSSESCEMFGPLMSVDTSRKPSTLQEAISMYIDFIVMENEKRTRISCCNILPMPLDFHKEDYYHEIMCQPIAFPTPKFRDWLKLYNVDIEITDPDGQTVSQTTFPPSANFSDTRVSIPTSMHMLNWQQQARGGGMPNQSIGVSASPRFNVPGLLRGRPKSRAGVGPVVRFGHPSSKVVAGQLPFEFMQSSPADRAANFRFPIGAVAGCGGVHHPSAPCVGGVMHQFQSISLPAIGSMQYFGHGPMPMPTNIQRPYPDLSTNNQLQMIGSFPGAVSAHAASKYYSMAPFYNPYPSEMAWRGCYSRPNQLLPEAKASAFAQMEAENLAAYMNRPEAMSCSDIAAMSSVPPVAVSMLPPFSSFVNGSSAHLPKEAVKGCLPVEPSDSCSKTCQVGEPAACGDHLQALNFAREPETARVLSSLPSDSCLDVGDASADAQSASHDPRFNWNDVKVYSRPGSGPVVKEMVDQGSQTEVDRVVVVTEALKTNGAETDAPEEDEMKDRELGLDSSICSFSCTDDFEESRKAEDQLNSEILLRNASIILSGSIEADETIQASAFTASHEDLLLNSLQAASTLGDLDGGGGLALSGDCNCIHSFMTVSLTCSSEDPPRASGEQEEEEDMCSGDGGGGDKMTATEYSGGDASCGDGGGVGLSKTPSDLLLEVGSNVEINTEGMATTVGGRGQRRGSDYYQPRRKRGRPSRGAHRQAAAAAVVGQLHHPWANTSSGRSQRKQQHVVEQTTMAVVDSTAFQDGDGSVADNF